MLRKLLTLVSGLLFSVPAMAQDQAQVEVFGGYSGQFFGSRTTSNLQGWNASPTWKFQDHVAIAADFGGYYGSHVERISASYSLHSFLFGPQFSTGVPKLERLNLFIHLLAGAARESTSVGVRTVNEQFQVGLRIVDVSSTAFAAAVGGGLDLNASDHVAFRVLQADWLWFYTNRELFSEQARRRARVSAGLVFRF
jgi:hypothetical protein